MSPPRPKSLIALLTVIGSLTLHAACHQPNGPPQLRAPDDLSEQRTLDEADAVVTKTWRENNGQITNISQLGGLVHNIL